MTVVNFTKKNALPGGSAFFVPTPFCKTNWTYTRIGLLDGRTHFLKNYFLKPPSTNKIHQKRDRKKRSRRPPWSHGVNSCCDTISSFFFPLLEEKLQRGGTADEAPAVRWEMTRKQNGPNFAPLEFIPF